MHCSTKSRLRVLKAADVVVCDCCDEVRPRICIKVPAPACCGMYAVAARHDTAGSTAKGAH
jgi:hypothetical protein